MCLQQERAALGTALDESKAEASSLKSDLRAAGTREASAAAALVASKGLLEETRAALADVTAREAEAGAKAKELAIALLTAQVSITVLLSPARSP